MKSSKKVKKDHIKSNLYKDILFWRKKKHLTQLQLADLLELNRKAVSDWEKGKTIPHETNRLKLGDIFGANVTPNGIMENHISMKTDNNQPEKGNIQVDDEWYKKTINSLINQHESILDRYTARTDRQIDGLEKDKLDLWELVRLHVKPPQ